MISAIGWNTRVSTLKLTDVMERRTLRLSGPTAWRSAAASALYHFSKANDLVREAVGCNAVLARDWCCLSRLSPAIRA